MRVPSAYAVILLAASVPSAAWGCNSVEAQTGMIWCKEQCNVPHSQPQCVASGRMANYARNGDALGVRNAFGDCQSGNDDDKIKQRVNVEDCFLHTPQVLIAAACAVYGGCPSPTPPAPPAPPPPTLKKIEFNQPMKAASDNKQIVIADFTLADQGAFRSITLDFRKDDKRVFNLSTYAVSVVPEGGALHLKVTTYDTSVRDVSKHKYSVAGTLEISVP